MVLVDCVWISMEKSSLPLDNLQLNSLIDMFSKFGHFFQMNLDEMRDELKTKLFPFGFYTVGTFEHYFLFFARNSHSRVFPVTFLLVCAIA